MSEPIPNQINSPWWKKRWIQNVCLVILGIIGVNIIVYLDVRSRAKESFLEGEKYFHWSSHPEEKKKYFEMELEKGKKEVEELFKKGKLPPDQYRQRLDALQFNYDFHMSESSLKYAYQWYKDTYELFSPPESKWVKMARKKALTTLELWKEELRAQKIPFEDYMFE
ncbi:MAG: hypothetical protein ACKVQC_01935 [Elusimicrobiota bacterium]